MTDAEREARCTWVCYLSDELDGGSHIDTECRDAAISAFSKLTDEERLAHLRWRGEVHDAVEAALHQFCPGRGDCCDEKFWPPQPGDRYTMVLPGLRAERQPNAVHTVAEVTDDGAVRWAEGGLSSVRAIRDGLFRLVTEKAPAS